MIAFGIDPTATDHPVEKLRLWMPLLIATDGLAAINAPIVLEHHESQKLAHTE